ncbi:ribbon-helix-helix domain-containing protein [Candidatus Bathyarchaeota archaeon]|nr:ribbon-helix-helix domain-containing protein [Candidatus Bathyarchaeota archaeon]
MKRITVSLPDELARRLRELSKESGLKVSGIVVKALEEHLGIKALNSFVSEAPVQPTVLWKLRGRSFARAPSPTLRRGKIGVWQIIELDKISV